MLYKPLDITQDTTPGYYFDAEKVREYLAIPEVDTTARALLTAAQRIVESYTRRKFTQREITFYYSSSITITLNHGLEIPYPPVSITSLSVDDSEVDSSQYTVLGGQEMPAQVFSSSSPGLPTPTAEIKGYKVVAQAGYSDGPPEELVDAALMAAAYMYEHRLLGAWGALQKSGAMQLAGPHRVWRV